VGNHGAGALSQPIVVGSWSRTGRSGRKRLVLPGRRWKGRHRWRGSCSNSRQVRPTSVSLRTGVGAFTENESMCGALEAAGLPPLLLVPLLDPPLPLLFHRCRRSPRLIQSRRWWCCRWKSLSWCPAQCGHRRRGLGDRGARSGRARRAIRLGGQQAPEPQPVTIIAPKQIDAPTIALW